MTSAGELARAVELLAPALSQGRRRRSRLVTGSARAFFTSKAGTTVYVPPGGRQSLENTGSDNIEFLCLVDPAWKSEDERILE